MVILFIVVIVLCCLKRRTVEIKNGSPCPINDFTYSKYRSWKFVPKLLKIMIESVVHWVPFVRQTFMIKNCLNSWTVSSARLRTRTHMTNYGKYNFSSVVHYYIGYVL